MDVDQAARQLDRRGANPPPSGDHRRAAKGRQGGLNQLWASLTRRRSRVLIAVAAVAIGATTLSGLATIATDLPRHLSRELRSLGANLVVSPAAGQEGITAATLDQVDRALAGHTVVAAVAFRYQPVRVANQSYLAAGADLAQVAQAKGYWDVQGDWPTGPGQVLVGADIAAWADLDLGETVTVTLPAAAAGGAADGALEPDSPATGDTASGTGTTAGGTAAATQLDATDTSQVLEAPPAATYTVTGIVNAGGSEDQMVVLWNADLEALAGLGRWDVAEYSVASEAQDLAALAEAVTQAVPVVQADPVQRLARSEADVLTMLRTLLWLVAGLVLVLTMIGVSTTMVAVVTERRSEIALRKALGAQQATINREFVAEALVLGVVGGLAGVGLGYGFAWAVGQVVFHRSIQMAWWVALVTVLAAVLVTRLGAILPLRRTAQIDPAVQLREE